MVGSNSRSRFVVGTVASLLALGGVLVASSPGQAAAGTATYSYTGSPVPIPDSPGPAATASIGISSQVGLVVTKVVLRIDGSACTTASGSTTVGINHDFDGDLQISLISPQGRRAVVIDRVGGAGNNFCQTVLDDDAATQIASGSAPFTGTFKPSNSLSVFNGEVDAFGAWTLSVRDRAVLDTGTIRGFSLILTTAEVPPHIALTSSSAAPGDCFVIVAEGLQPFAQYQIVMGRNQVLTPAFADDNGVFDRVECVPARTPVGTQVITVTGPGGTQSATIRVTR